MSIAVEVSITRKFTAAHSLPGIGVAEAHEHSYEVECGYRAHVDDQLGCSRPMQALAVEVDGVVAQLDGRSLNDVLVVPTAEMLAAWILRQLPDYWEWASIRAYAGFKCTVRRADLP